MSSICLVTKKKRFWLGIRDERIFESAQTGHWSVSSSAAKTRTMPLSSLNKNSTDHSPFLSHCEEAPCQCFIWRRPHAVALLPPTLPTHTFGSLHLKAQRPGTHEPHKHNLLWEKKGLILHCPADSVTKLSPLKCWVLRRWFVSRKLVKSWNGWVLIFTVTFTHWSGAALLPAAEDLGFFFFFTATRCECGQLWIRVVLKRICHVESLVWNRKLAKTVS